MDNTLYQILQSLFEAHVKIDQLTAEVNRLQTTREVEADGTPEKVERPTNRREHR